MAGLPSPFHPASPVFATVAIFPSGVNLRTRWPSNSAMYRLPAASTATLRGESSDVSNGPAPSGDDAFCPVPAIVVIVPSGAIFRTRSFP